MNSSGQENFIKSARGVNLANDFIFNHKTMTYHINNK